ncbi:hypothetical protein J5X84_42905 [Streptosporangiaceae bacterium NEAU-GS5]|nr:hypothetical protein [Streptosporangiaceae bacterium NEAU-GS5]
MTVSWTLATPLLLPEEHGPVTGAQVTVPGSSVKGAVRSLHETLMGGCLRVFDEEFVPVYRQPAVAKEGDWWLGAVREATRDGRATRVEVTVRTVWVPIEALPKMDGRRPRSGDTIEIDESAIVSGTLDRKEVEPWGVRPGNGWVILVGDSGSRMRSQRFFVAAGELAGDEDDLRDVPEEVWESYLALCAGTNDMRQIKQDPDSVKFKGWRTERVFAPVTWSRDQTSSRRPVVAERRRVTGRLRPGDVVWVRLDQESGDIAELAMAAIWRVKGARETAPHGFMGQRVPAALHACSDWQSLCVSCRLFGSADTSGALPGEEAEQHSYAGHVRMGDAVAEKVTTIRVARLAPMGAPRPGAGQFYLRISDKEPAGSKEDLPSAYWGSRQDATELRRLRGRKFYWHGDPMLQPVPRHVARDEQSNEAMSGARDMVPAETVLTQQITFDNIPKAELGSLLVTLLPRLLLARTEPGESGDYALRLGGGKPLGLGSCRVAVTALEWWESATRYMGGQAFRTSPEEFLALKLDDRSVMSHVAVLAGPDVRRQWPVVSRVLRADAVDPQLIWYPHGGTGAKRDRSFVFFNQSNGQFYENTRRPVIPLPDPDPGTDQTMRPRLR